MIERYICTKCHAHPSTEAEVLRGCQSCGNGLFRLVEQAQPRPTQPSTPASEDQLGSIEVDGEGVFRIDVSGLFEGSRSNVLSVQDSDGVVHIRF